MELTFDKIGRFVGRDRLPNLDDDLKCAGIHVNPESFLGFHTVVILVLPLVSLILVWLLTSKWYFGAMSILLTAVIYYFLVSGIIGLMIEQRKSYVEKVLPDALQLMAANLRSGVSADEALALSAREEFGFFGKNIKAAGNRISMSTPIDEAFKSIGEGIRSDTLKQTIDLILEGIESGGELASVLEGTADDIRDTDILKREVRSVLLLYALFIFIAAVVISPILYAVSTQLAGVLSELSRTASAGFLGGKNTPELEALKPSTISLEFLTVFAYINIIITSIFGSLIMALINKGNEKYGIRYMPFMLGIALLLFYIARIVMGNVFGGIKVL